MTDEALETVARTLSDRLGRLPTGAELIEAVGGCQKQRALRAIQSLRAKRAEQEIHALLVLAPSIDAELRALMARWIGLAAQQLSDRHAQVQAQTDARLEESAIAAAELERENESLRAQIVDLQKVQRELISRTHSLQSKLDAAIRDRDTAQALAGERERVMAAVISAREVPHGE